MGLSPSLKPIPQNLAENKPPFPAQESQASHHLQEDTWALSTKHIIGDIITPLNPPTPPPPLSQSNISRPNETPFRTSIAIIVAVLTTIFSVTFLLLLYAKHCKRGNGNAISVAGYDINDPNVRAARKHSGIDRAVIESLPIFRFSSLRGQKEGLECAVCLTRFEPTEVLKLLPKCKHAFHVECVDTWLDAHSTCPLCRYRLDPEDVLLIEKRC
ncbi:RING-H2 finger protein ATL43-like [Populus alba x Populus x berolinensis]|nr:RING-H2 finger protein ATL43-like [Populus alba x Populus x berolinensis]